MMKIMIVIFYSPRVGEDLIPILVQGMVLVPNVGIWDLVVVVVLWERGDIVWHDWIDH